MFINTMARRISSILTSGLVALALVSPAAAQPAEEIESLRREIEALKGRQEKIQKEIAIIKNVLRGLLAAQARGREAPQRSKPLAVRVEGNPFKGDKNARVTLIDFSDFQ